MGLPKIRWLSLKAPLFHHEEQRRRERFSMPLDLNPKLISDSAILLFYCT
jgi:hypothetical protein